MAGAPEEIVERARKQQDDSIEVLSCNWQAVQVFQGCQGTYIVRGMGTRCIGIAAREVHCAIALMQVSAADWPQLLDDVQLMGKAAAKTINDKFQQAEA